jgi:hypothetical protein
MTHTCPPTQINTNNDEGRIQRELCLGITVWKREILHPHNKTWFHTKKYVVIQKHGIFHLHNKYDKKNHGIFRPTLTQAPTTVVCLILNHISICCCSSSCGFRGWQTTLFLSQECLSSTNQG